MALSTAAQMEMLIQLKAALSRRDRAETNRFVTMLLDQGAALGEQWKSISKLMRMSGELTLAFRAVDAFIAAAPNNSRALYSKVVLLTQTQRLQEAHDLLLQLPEDVPDRSGRAYVLGNTALTLGRVNEAQAHLLEAIEQRPGWGPAWLSLMTAGIPPDHPLADRLLAEGSAAERQNASDFARYCYARGKLLGDRGDLKGAFAAYARGAGLLKRNMSYSRDADATNARAARSGLDSSFFKHAHRLQSGQTNRPIFVTGLPRSGTTLVEQILASHSEVLDGGELNIVQHVAVAAGGVSGDVIRQVGATQGMANALGELYLYLLSERFGASGRIVDKTIDASRFIGLIATALPEAPIVWMRRDPLDNALSCFRTFFIHGAAWSYDLADIAYHFQLEDELLAYWKEELGDRILVVPYQELVEDPKLWTSRLLRHCGLGEEPGVHTPHLTKRRVATASSLQVRRPINRDGLRVAERYSEYMQPFVQSYGSR